MAREKRGTASGKWSRSARERLGLTQREVAERVAPGDSQFEGWLRGVESGHILRPARGRVGRGRLALLATFYGEPIPEEDDMPNSDYRAGFDAGFDMGYEKARRELSRAPSPDRAAFDPQAQSLAAEHAPTPPPRPAPTRGRARS